MKALERQRVAAVAGLVPYEEPEIELLDRCLHAEDLVAHVNANCAVTLPHVVEVNHVRRLAQVPRDRVDVAAPREPIDGLAVRLNELTVPVPHEQESTVDIGAGIARLDPDGPPQSDNGFTHRLEL